jgi:glycosyltransferase involved in cell wall biosynthesis
MSVADRAGAAIERIVVIHDFASAEGGAGVLANLAAQEYVRRGIPVTFFAGAIDRAGQSSEGVELTGLQLTRLLDTSKARAMVQGFHNRAARACLAQWIAENDTDRTVYHLHNWSQILSPAIFAALQGVEARLIVTCHDFFNVCPNGGFTDFPRSRTCDLKPLSLACAARQCDRRSSLDKYWRMARQIHLNRLTQTARSMATFTFLHERMKTKFVESGFSAYRMVTIANPVEPWCRERVPAERNREFLFVGRLGRDKGADLAADAAVEAGVPLTFVGTGELEGTLSETDGSLRLAGWCDPARICVHARRARALIVPSRVVEPFGLVILEAAMSGLPVIVSDRAYLAADAERLGFGLSFDPAIPGKLSGLVAALAGSDAMVHTMSRNGFGRSGELVSSAAEWSEQFIQLFRAMLPPDASTRSTRCDAPDCDVAIPGEDAASPALAPDPKPPSRLSAGSGLPLPRLLPSPGP